MQTKTHSTHLAIIFISLFVVLFVFFTYTFLHEAGHALVGLIFGQSLTEFNVSFWDLSAHVGLTGGELTPSQVAIRALAGVSLPLLIWTVFMPLVPRKSGFTLEILKLLASMLVLNTLLAWIVIPVLYILGKAPPSEDVTHFLLYSQMQPLLLTVTALIVYVCGGAYFLSKIHGLRNEFLLFRDPDSEIFTSRTLKTASLMISIMTLCAMVVIALNMLAAKNSSNKFSPPADFSSVAQVDLSPQGYTSKVLAEFSLDESAYVGVFVTVHNIDTTYFDLSVTGPNGYSSVVLHGEGYKADQDGGLWEENLLPGTYQMVLTSHQSPGIASVFLKIHQ